MTAARRLRQLPPGLLLALSAVALAAGVAVAWRPLVRHGRQLAEALGAADPALAALAVAAAAAAVISTALAWHAAACTLGSRAGAVEGTSRYALGCLAPPKCGNPVRIALLARTLPGRRSLWAMTGVCGGVSVARMLPLSLVMVAAAATNAVPVWLGLALAALTLALLAIALAACRRAHGERLSRLLAGFALLAASRRTFSKALVWLSLATLAKVAVALATAAAIGIGSPEEAALVLVPSLAVGRMLPFFGVAAGTLAVGTSGGVGAGSALELAVAVSAVEGLGGILCGVAGGCQLVRLAHLRDWRGSLGALRQLVAARATS